MKDAIFESSLVKLLPGDFKNKVGTESKSTTAKEDATFLLKNVIVPAIENGNSEPFTTLLSKMEASDFSTLQDLAKEIRKKIQPGIGKKNVFIGPYVIISSHS